MSTSIDRRRALGLVTALVAVAVAGVVASSGQAQGVTPEQLASHGWTCLVPPPLPDKIACFNPGLGRPFPGNPDPRPSYNTLTFDRASGEFLYTVHLVRGDLYNGRPCGDHPYIFRAPIGYWECLHT